MSILALVIVFKTISIQSVESLFTLLIVNNDIPHCSPLLGLL